MKKKVLSFIYTINKVRPRTEPWGTPDTTCPRNIYMLFSTIQI